jgi:hypothetical protein
VTPQLSDRQLGNCLAELYKITPAGRSLLWSRYLINNVAPLDVHVGMSGGYVVTMDEWGEKGFLPLVVYGAGGRLLRVFSLQDLLTKEELSHLERSVSSIQWRQKALVVFLPNNELIIRLSSGHEIWVDLAKADLLQKAVVDAEENSMRIRSVVCDAAVAALDSPNADEREAGATHCGQLKITKAIARLKELAAHDESRRVYGLIWRKEVFPVREAARVALQQMKVEYSQPSR